MFIQSNNYQIKDEESTFTELHKNEFPISFVKALDSKIIYSSRNELFTKTTGGNKKLATLDSDISCITTHQDLLCVGSRSGAVQIFSDYRKCIRSYNDHDAPINDILIYQCDKSNAKIVMSCSDDGLVKCYMLTEEKSFNTMNINDGYVKSVAYSEGKIYIGTKNFAIYSAENGERIFFYENNEYINKIVALNDKKIAFISKNKLSIFDQESLTINTKMIHSKDCGSLVGLNGILYTASLDGHLKSFNSEIKKISDFNLRSKIVSFDIFGESPLIVLENGIIVGIKEEKIAKNRVKAPKLPKKPVYEDDIDYKVIEPIKKRLTEIESLLGKFEYKKCLKIIMEKDDINLSYTVLKYLQENRGLKKALVDEKEEFIASFLNFCIDHFSIKEFNSILIECIIIVTSIYSEMLIENNDLKELLLILSEVVDEEVAFQEANLKAIAFLECFDK